MFVESQPKVAWFGPGLVWCVKAWRCLLLIVVITRITVERPTESWSINHTHTKVSVCHHIPNEDVIGPKVDSRTLHICHPWPISLCPMTHLYHSKMNLIFLRSWLCSKLPLLPDERLQNWFTLDGQVIRAILVHVWLGSHCGITLFPPWTNGILRVWITRWPNDLYH